MNRYAHLLEYSSRDASIVWRIANFRNICEELNVSTVPHPHVDSPKFGIDADGPQFFMRLYTKGNQEDAADYFSLEIKLECAGNDSRWIKKNASNSNICTTIDIVLLDASCNTNKQICTYAWMMIAAFRIITHLYVCLFISRCI